jgi:hypothetical protein
MNHIALKQNIQQLPITIGGSPEKAEPQFEVFRNIDGTDVYHVSNCTFFPRIENPELTNRRTQRVGEFYHPYLMFGMPHVGGSVKLHIDTRFEGYYVLWAGTKLDEWACGPSKRFWDVVTWTPRVPGDTIRKASYRLTKALFMAIDYVKDNEWKSDLYQNEDWEQEWSGSTLLIDIMREIRD